MDIISIRETYKKIGVTKFYENIGENYENLHFNQVKYLIEKNLIFLDKENKILDLCCGKGEVSSILFNHGFKKLWGCDPYLHKTYEKLCKRRCFPYSFKNLLEGKLTENFDVIICSFGLHLCPEKQLTSLLNIFRYYLGIKTLIIITPNKKPNLEGLIYQEEYKRVKYKVYNI